MFFNSGRIFRTDYVSLVTAILYVFIFRFIYTDYLVPLWGYFGYYNNNSDGIRIITSNIFAVLPILCYSNKKVISNLISILIYILVYLPTIIMIQYYFVDFQLAIKYQLVFLLGMTLFFLSDIDSGKVVILKKNYIPIKFYLWVGIIMLLFVVIYYGSSLRLVSFSKIYELRVDNYGAKLSRFPLIGYFILWISNFFRPLFLSIGLVYKKKEFVLIGVLMAILIYMATATKGTLFSPLFAFGLYWCLKYIGFKYLFPLIVFFFLLVVSLFKLTEHSESSISSVFFVISAILLMRSLGISALLNTVYIDFFETTKLHTYYTHINVVNSIFGGYPFGEDALGKAVWGGYSGENADDAMNANANFLATDGVAAMGIWGVLLVSILFYFLLKYLNKVSKGHNTDFVFILCLGSILSLLNVSIFTTLLSCGLILIIICLKYSTIRY